MASEYTKTVTIAVPEGFDASAIEASINMHLSGNNRFANASQFETSGGSIYRVLSFAAREDFTLTPPSGVLMAIDAINTSGLSQLDAMGLQSIEVL